MSQKTFAFESYNKGEWLSTISSICQALGDSDLSNSFISVHLPHGLTPSSLEPMHIVTLACLICKMKTLKASGTLIGEESLITYLRNNLNLSDFIASEKAVSTIHYTDSLWNVADKYSGAYSHYMSNYLHHAYFSNRDPSGLKVVLDELFANIADHSNANGIAYSFIKYNPSKDEIRIAFCDFGMGIPQSLKNSGNNISFNFIEKAVKPGVSAHSNIHNKGYGLDTVVSSIANTGNIIRIVSGGEFFISYGDGTNYKTYALPQEFPGTLIYFDLPVATFEDFDIISNEYEI